MDRQQRQPMGGNRMGFINISQKPTDFKKSMSKLISYLALYKINLAFIALLSIFSIIIAVAGPKILGNITTSITNSYIQIQGYDNIVPNLPKYIPSNTSLYNIIEKSSFKNEIPSNFINLFKNVYIKQKPQIDFGYIEKIALILIILYIVNAIFYFLQSWIAISLTQSVTYKLRAKVSEKLYKLPLRYFDTVPYGDILSRITNDIDTLNQSLNQTLTQITSSVLTVIGIVIMMITINVYMTLISLLTIPLSLFVISTIIKSSQKYFKTQQELLGEVNGLVEESFSGFETLKAYNAEEFIDKKFTELNDSLYITSWKSQFYSGLMFPIINFIGNIGYVLVSIVGGILAIRNAISIGDIQAFIQYINQMNQPVAQIGNIAGILQTTSASAERVFEFLELEEDIKNIDEIEIENLDEISANISFSGVKFGYTEQKEIIHNFNLEVKSGMKVAIVGPTGAGKTTLVNLLMRFYDPTGGEILLDGINMKRYTKKSIRSIIGMVLQDTWVFTGSIRDNIAYANPTTEFEKIKSIAKLIQINHFIMSLPDGYDYIIGENTSILSSGEKQLITIARAFIQNSKILILDEATSSVDTRTEKLIQSAMEKLTEGRTTFVIAHRLSTIKSSDIIIVLNNGDVVESGNHNELIDNHGFYYNLYMSQFDE